MKYYPPRYLFRRYEILRHVRRGNRFLEIGPGNLNLAQDLLSYFDTGTLIDFNPDVERVFDRLPVLKRERLELIIADFSSIPFTGTYNCVVACEVLEHVEKDEEFLNLLVDLLDTGGQLILSVPSRMKFWSRHDEIVGHVRRYEKQQLFKLLSKYKLKNINIVSYGFPFVNILSWPRIFLAKLQYDRKSKWTQKEQTQRSGIVQSTELVDWLGIISNQYTVYPLNIISSLFNRYDLSDGYVVTAERI